MSNMKWNVVELKEVKKPEEKQKVLNLLFPFSLSLSSLSSLPRPLRFIEKGEGKNNGE